MQKTSNILPPEMKLAMQKHASYLRVLGVRETFSTRLWPEALEN